MRRSPTDLIEGTANAQHGIVSRAQLLDSGLPESTIDRRLRSGRLRPVHRGVYALRGGLGLHARAMAATLACGARSFVSHVTAAALTDIVPEPDRTEPVDISLPGRGHRRVAGIHKHADRQGAPEDVTALDGIPITTPIRTLIDLASVFDFRGLERAVARSERNGLVTADLLRRALAGLSAQRGVAKLRQLLGQAERILTRSAAEEILLQLVRAAGLPMPRANVRIGRYEVDFLWPAERVIVEVDGYRYHSSRHHFEEDRARDAFLVSRGYRIIRLTWKQLTDEDQRLQTLVRLAQVLAVATPAR